MGRKIPFQQVPESGTQGMMVGEGGGWGEDSISVRGADKLDGGGGEEDPISTGPRERNSRHDNGGGRGVERRYHFSEWTR